MMTWQVLPELSRAALAHEYAQADAFVLPTRGEGWCLPCVEAMSAGLVTDAWGPVEPHPSHGAPWNPSFPWPRGSPPLPWGPVEPHPSQRVSPTDRGPPPFLFWQPIVVTNYSGPASFLTDDVAMQGSHR